MKLCYNCFVGKPPTVTQWLNPPSPSLINFNSIYGIEPGTTQDILKIDPQQVAGNLNLDMDATQNYWEGLTEQDVEKLIYDKNDDISIKNEVEFLPMLDAPHRDTPSCGD